MAFFSLPYHAASQKTWASTNQDGWGLVVPLFQSPESPALLPFIGSFLTDLTQQTDGLAAVGWLAPTWMLAQDAPVEPTFFQNFLSNPLLLPIGVVTIFYITYFAPERRRRAEEAQMMASLGKNDRVVTVGGIHGTIVSAAPDSDTVTLKIDESGSTRIKVNRSAIVKILGDPKSKPKEDDGSTKKETASKG